MAGRNSAEICFHVYHLVIEDPSQIYLVHSSVLHYLLTMLARRNHRLVAIPFSATASFLANVASISAWANTACFLWHPDTLKNHHLRTRSLASSTAHLRLRPIEHVTRSSDASSCQRLSVGATSRLAMETRMVVVMAKIMM